jgi:hypothetical protein
MTSLLVSSSVATYRIAAAAAAVAVAFPGNIPGELTSVFSCSFHHL